MVAIIQTGGKQYCVEAGQILLVPRVNALAGETVTLENLLGGASLTATVVEQVLGPKVVTRKFRNKTRYHRVKGHRQPLTSLKIEGSAPAAAPKAARKTEPKAS